MLDLKNTKDFGPLIDRTLRKIRIYMGRKFKEVGVDITPEQWVILSSLYDNNGQSQTDLSDGSFKNAPTVSRIIDLLCEKGLTERQRFESDRRRYKIFLTPKGKEIVETALPAVIDIRTKGWAGLSEEDYQHFKRIINQIFDNFDD